ncbi:MAG: Asp-tRNA(Asn)/Glu-tRNA(Gln) amidotransferase subunit GatA [Candidatus Tectomicrobia bacterium]|nr:Asp-tRNA(Asn)/Glu-tRNA(Gln) amidotransferase subunit GatA [Candidatus Tectomicrobia bacterium]
MTQSELPFFSLHELAPLLKRGEISPVELTKALLERIEALNGSLVAYITIVADEALAAAKSAEEAIRSGAYRGPLHGIPIALKEVFETKGIRTTAGAKILENHIPETNSTVAEQLSDAGAILLGKTNMHEFAAGFTGINEHFGTSRNPWDLERIAGGSSSGSGTAVAASLAIAAMGSDTGGSIRVPSSFCGLVGLKPTTGRVSSFGVIPLSWTFDHAGPMTKKVEDAALMLNILAGSDPLDPTTWNTPPPLDDYTTALTKEIRGLKVGVPTDYFFEEIDPEIDEAVRKAIRLLESFGAIVEEVPFPQARAAREIFMTIVTAEAYAYHRENLEKHPDKFGERVRRFVEGGREISSAQYIQALQTMKKLRREMGLLFEKADLIVTPATPVPASKIGEPRGSIGHCTLPVNPLGLCAIALPCGFTSEGLPIGLQILGKPFDEATILCVAHHYEQATEWHKRRAPV